MILVQNPMWRKIVFEEKLTMEVNLISFSNTVLNFYRPYFLHAQKLFLKKKFEEKSKSHV